MPNLLMDKAIPARLDFYSIDFFLFGKNPLCNSLNVR